MHEDKAPQPTRNWVLVHDQHPEVVIERNRAASMHPEVHAAFARSVRAKAEAEGLLYRDTNNPDYYARFKSDPNAAPEPAKAARK